MSKESIGVSSNGGVSPLPDSEQDEVRLQRAKLARAIGAFLYHRWRGLAASPNAASPDAPTKSKTK